jgi:arylsulfatase A
MKRPLTKVAWTFTLWFCVSANCEDEFSNNHLPNIVILLADNLGYADVSPETTPHISSIGDRGRTFGNFHSAAHLCSASRAALLTGVYPAKSGIYPGTFAPDAALGLSPRRFPTLATLLQQKSRDEQKYATAMIGKWHLGHAQEQYLPTDHGFDEYLGIPYHMSGGSIDNHICAYDSEKRTQWLPLYQNTTIVQQPVDVRQLAETYATAAKSFIQRQVASNTPFFLYMAFSHVHQLCASFDRPEQSFCQWSGKEGDASSFHDAVQEMDWIVGEILATLERAGAVNDTLVLFTSDNGPWLAEQSCSGLRGPFLGQWYELLLI